MRRPAFPHSLRRLLAHAGLAVALLLAQMGMLGHAYTAHPLNVEAAPAVAARATPAGKLQHGTDARDLCSLCLAYSVFAGSLPAAYHLDALALPVAVFVQPHAHGAPLYPFVSYASRAPPFPKA
ncbi:MAG: hypothetical protein JWN73_2326 [Betaproteobacteria bacterium]|nr:hypothetical protein [Betaproteobacteria bacterium]